MKLGRNAPCWCGSGKKYKLCHLGRAEADETPISDALTAIKNSRGSRGCQSPQAMHSECSGDTINSHTISKTLGLIRIAEAGHVLGLKHDISTLSRTNGRAELGKIGINKISVFPGFCAVHDKSLFAPIEDEPFEGTAEQCALLSYRALARERHTKLSGIDVNEFLKGADKGKTVAAQMAIQKMLADFGLGLSLAAKDLDRALIPHYQALSDRNFGVFESAIFEFSDDFPLLCSTGHMPSDDWSGRIIQDLPDSKLQADWVTGVALLAADRAWIVFTWLRSRKLIADFIDSLGTHFAGQESDALVKYFFSISENIAVRPTWWAGLAKPAKAALEARIMDGVPIGSGANVIAPQPGEPIVLDLPLLSYRRI